MSVKLVKEEIAKFLSRREPEVLCIRGKWGVGKTHRWAKQVEAAQQAKTIKLPRYSYVSLFGVNSLDELKFAIFENVITLSEGIKKPDLETLDAFISKFGSWRKLNKDCTIAASSENSSRSRRNVTCLVHDDTGPGHLYRRS
jgi:hypothetical protein